MKYVVTAIVLALLLAAGAYASTVVVTDVDTFSKTYTDRVTVSSKGKTNVYTVTGTVSGTSTEYHTVSTPDQTVTVTVTGTTTTSPPTTTTTPPPPPTGYPDASNTGLTNPSLLTTYTGSYSVTTPGLVLENKIFNGRLDINASNVTIRNSKFTGNPFVALDVNASGFLIEDSEFDVTGDDAIWGGNNWVGRRLNIHGSEDGMKMSGGTLEDSYIHDLKLCGTCHTDGIQIMGTNYPTTMIRHNTISAPAPPEFGNGAFQIANETCCGGAISGVTVDNNLLSGGGFTFRVHQQYNLVAQGALTNNHFVRNSYEWGAISMQEDNPGQLQWTCSGNVYHDNLQPLGC